MGGGLVVFIDRVYPECMEILNRGRGAGKSHALALWQLEDPANRRIVTNEYNLEQYFQLGVSTVHAYTYEQATAGRLIGFTGAIGFDDFDVWAKKVIFDKFRVDVNRSDDSTILVTTLAESELLPGPTMLPVNPDYAAKVYDYLNEKLPGAAALLGVVTPETPKEEDMEPTTPITKRLDVLTYGEYVNHWGRVVGISEGDALGTLVVKFRTDSTETTMRGNVDDEV